MKGLLHMSHIAIARPILPTLRRPILLVLALALPLALTIAMPPTATPSPTPTLAPSSPSSTPTPSPTATPSDDPFAGHYYFRGIHLMRIRADGETWQTHLYGEAEMLAGRADDLAPLRIPPHRARRVGDDGLVFADMPADWDSLGRHYGLTDDDWTTGAPPSGVALAPIAPGKRFYERWRFLDDGRVRVESALPICHPPFSSPTLALAPTVGRVPGATPFGALLGDYGAVCAWRVGDDREVQGWQALEEGDYETARDRFAAAAQAQPDKPFAHLGLANAHLGLRAFDAATTAVADAEKRFDSENGPYLRLYAGFLRDQIHSHRVFGSPDDLLDFLADPAIAAPVVGDLPMVRKPARLWSADEVALARQRVLAYPGWPALQTAARMQGRGPLAPIGQAGATLQSRALDAPPQLETLQQMAVLCWLAGGMEERADPPRPAAAIHNYGLSVQLGRLARHGVLLARMGGVAVQEMGVQGIESLIAHGHIATTETLQALEVYGAYLVTQTGHTGWGDFFGYENVATAMTTDPVLYTALLMTGLPNPARTRDAARTLDGRLTLIHGAAAVKRQALTPPYPRAVDALPADPFQTGGPVRYRVFDEGAWLASAGPNGVWDWSGAAPPTAETIGDDLLLPIR